MTEARVPRSGRKLLGVTVGLAAMSFVGTACTTGNLVADAGPVIDTPRTDTPSEADAPSADDAPPAKDDAGP